MTERNSQIVVPAKKRERAQVESKLERKLLAYAAVAGAAGVGILATAQPAEGKVVFTAVNSEIAPAFALDLNHDGVNDFNLIRWGARTSSAAFDYLNVCHNEVNGLSHQCVSSSFAQNASNLVRTTVAGGAADLPFGANIGPGQQWGGKGVAELMGDHIVNRIGSLSTTSQRWLGAWANGGKGVTNRYLGLKFKIGNQFHYGWARVTFKTNTSAGYNATITGYAYETIPGKAILAGATGGTADVAGATTLGQESSLGILAFGSTGLPAWRKEME